MDRLLRYRVENARPEDVQRGKPLPGEVAAARADVSYRQWQRWEGGESTPHPRNLELLSANLGIPIAEFFPAPGPAAVRDDETPDLGAALNGNGDAAELRDQLDRIETTLAGIVSVLDAMGEASESTRELFDSKLERLLRGEGRAGRRVA